LNIDLISFDQRCYIKSYRVSNVWPLPLLHYLRLYSNSNVAELQCRVLVKRKIIPAHGELGWTSQHLSREIACRG